MKEHMSQLMGDAMCRKKAEMVGEEMERVLARLALLAAYVHETLMAEQCQT